MDPGQIAQRFPLVARPRPACRPLNQRIREIGDLARNAAGQTDALAQAAAAHNKAALIASDCGLPELARSLCWRHFEVYLRAQPLGAQAARLALEPLVNLARLLIRDGDGDGAHHLLDTLFHTVRSRTDATIDGRHLSFQHLTQTDEDHRTLCQWLWTVLLADGTRALTAAGRWEEALAHVEQHNGVGQRMLDGRQVAILAHCLAGDPTSALALLEETTLIEPWEQAVAACLTVFCLNSSLQRAGPDIAAMAAHYLGLDRTPDLVVFRTRLGLIVIDLAGGTGHPAAAYATTRLVEEASGDGYAARDVLANGTCRAQLTTAQERALTTAVQSSGLGRGALPEFHMTDLLEAITRSETTVAQTLGSGSPAGWFYG